MHVIAELMQEQELLKYQDGIATQFEEKLNIDGDRIFSELNSANWWKKSERELRERCGEESFLLPIILYLDATQLDVTGKNSAKPVCVTLGNFCGKIRVSMISIISNPLYCFVLLYNVCLTVSNASFCVSNAFYCVLLLAYYDYDYCCPTTEPRLCQKMPGLFKRAASFLC